MHMSLPFLLSNWTKHDKNCYVKHQSQVPKIHQSTLELFMTRGQVSTEKNETQSENATDSIEGIEMVDLTTNVEQVFQ